jgi:hypothetical protein
MTFFDVNVTARAVACIVVDVETEVIALLDDIEIAFTQAAFVVVVVV